MSTQQQLWFGYKARLVTVTLSELKTNLFVRERLDDDRVTMLLDLFTAGKEIDPIVVNRDREIIDGRHRRMMYEIADRHQFLALEVDISNPEELIAVAYKANAGGALPPTREDTEHTVSQLVARNASAKRIAEVLALPVEVVRHYVKEVRAKVERRAIQVAINDITAGGLTVSAAAEKHGLDIEKLKAAISPKKKKERRHVVGEIQRQVTTLFRSSSRKVSHVCQSLFERLDDGDFTIEQVQEVLEHIEHLQDRSRKSLSEAMRRLKARANGSTDEKAA